MTTNPPASGAVEHRPDCTSPQLVEHETGHRRHIVCKACHAHVTLARVERWRQS